MTNPKLKISQDIAIKLTNLSKKYYIHHEKPTLAERLLNGKDEEFWALKNISLTVYKGESVGIIGANGSGKTTLLKLITGIATPTSGKINTFGKVVSLIDLEAGFHPDLTGIQNIYLNGSLLGLSKNEISKKLKDIVKLSSIGRFIDAPLYTYSTGMKLRIGFSVAVKSEPDILILDENISVGDEKFKQASLKEVENIGKLNKTLIFATHDLGLIAKYCNKIVWLRRGKIENIGQPKKIIPKYIKSSALNFTET